MLILYENYEDAYICCQWSCCIGVGCR